MVADVAASDALVVAVFLLAKALAASAATLDSLDAAAVAELAELVAEALACPALVDALEALVEAPVAESAALIACCVTSLRVASWVESPEPPVPRNIAILLHHFKN